MTRHTHKSVAVLRVYAKARAGKRMVDAKRGPVRHARKVGAIRNRRNIDPGNWRGEHDYTSPYMGRYYLTPRRQHASAAE